MRDKFVDTDLIPVMDLQLDVANYRYHGSLGTQQDCINAMLRDNRAKIISLAKDITEIGLTPDHIVVIKDEKGGWVVKEGNRRVAALQLMNNPNLISDSRLRKMFEALLNKSGNSIPDQIKCLECLDPEMNNEYVDRLHSGERNGTGRIPWTAENIDYFRSSRGQKS